MNATGVEQNNNSLEESDSINGTRKHDCKLFPPPVPILHLVIDSGILINLRRKVMEWCMVYEGHPSTAKAYRSLSAKRQEDIRLLSNNFYIIHPFSRIALYWEFIFAVALIIYMFNLLIRALYKPDIKDTYINEKILRINMMLGTFFLLDILKSFITGYYDTEHSKAILKPKYIAKHYLKTDFLLDFLPWTTMIFMILAYCEVEVNWVLVAVIRFMTYLRLYQCVRLRNSIDLLCLYAHMSTWVCRIVKFFILLTMLLLAILALLFFAKGNYDRYIEAGKTRWSILINIEPLYFLWSLLLHVSSLADFYGHLGWSTVDRIFFIVVMIIGYGVNLYIIALVYRIWIHFWSKDRFDDLHDQINQYLKYKRLPAPLRAKIFAFYEYQYKNRYFDENRISRMLPKLLRQEVLLSITKNHIKQVDLFREIPDNVMSLLVLRLKSEIFLTNDVIVKAGTPGDSMFFIYFGTVAIYSPTGTEICHLDDGDHFGEIALIFKERRVATVKAITSCEIFKLTREDFLAVLEPHPELTEKVCTLALQRLKGVRANLY